MSLMSFICDPPRSGRYTIGYYGRIFEAKGKTKGGAFDAADKEYLRFVLGKQPMIPALEEAIASMKPGGVRQVCEQIRPRHVGEAVRSIDLSGLSIHPSIHACTRPSRPSTQGGGAPRARLPRQRPGARPRGAQAFDVFGPAGAGLCPQEPGARGQDTSHQRGTQAGR